MSENLDNFVTLAEAAAYLKVSERTIRRRIKDGELEDRKHGGKLLVYLPDAAKTGQSADMSLTEVDKLKQDLNRLEEENERLALLAKGLEETVEQFKATVQDKETIIRIKDDQLEQKDAQIREMSQRHDTIVMQMTRLIEYHQQPFWRKLLRRRQLPPPKSEVVDMEGKNDIE